MSHTLIIVPVRKLSFHNDNEDCIFHGRTGIDWGIGEEHLASYMKIILNEVSLDLIALYADIKLFHFFSRPGSFAQEREARLDAGIKPETPDVNYTAQVFPPKMLDEFSQDHFQCFPMKRIFCPHSDKSKSKHRELLAVTFTFLRAT